MTKYLSNAILKRKHFFSGSWLEGIVHYVRNGSAAEHGVTGPVAPTVKKQRVTGPDVLLPFTFLLILRLRP